MVINMKRKIKSIGIKNILWISLCVFSVIMIVLLHVGRMRIQNGLTDQNLASRWSEENNWTQISCFFSDKVDITEDRIYETRYQIENKLKEASVDVESESSTARLYVDGYSATGSVVATNGDAKFSGNAYGVGGDYFLFHPLKLVEGSYFSDKDLMDDYVLIDEEIAWTLFGSSDVVGRYITISNVPHVVVGVYHREQDRMSKLAGNDLPTMYLSYHSLSLYGTNRGIKTYEVLLPNPISGFGDGIITKVLGMDEYSVSIVENTNRFQLKNLWDQMKNYPSRSMSSLGIIYPFWENIARGYEDYAILLLIWEGIFCILPLITLIIIFVRIGKRIKGVLYRHKLKRKPWLRS